MTALFENFVRWLFALYALEKDILAQIDLCNTPVHHTIEMTDGPPKILAFPRMDPFGTGYKGLALLMRLRGFFWPDLRTWLALRSLVRQGILVQMWPNSTFSIYRRPIVMTPTPIPSDYDFIG